MDNKDVPYVVHESDMARMERSSKRLWIAILLLIILLVGSNIAWVAYESQFETLTVEAEQDGYGVNIVSGGDADYGPES